MGVYQAELLTRQWIAPYSDHPPSSSTLINYCNFCITAIKLVHGELLPLQTTPSPVNPGLHVQENPFGTRSLHVALGEQWWVPLIHGVVWQALPEYPAGQAQLKSPINLVQIPVCWHGFGWQRFGPAAITWKRKCPGNHETASTCAGPEKNVQAI